MLLALILAQALPLGNPEGPIFNQPSLMRQWGVFEFAPADGRGMPAPCSTVAPVGYFLGSPVTLTATRASEATCTKTAAGGLAVTGIANGDVVRVATNVMRVEHDSDSARGMRGEETRQNVIVESEQFDIAPWGNFGTAPVITANAGTSPDGARTAERIRFFATATTGSSIRFQTIAGASIASAYVKGCIVESDGGCAEGITSAGDGGLLYADGGAAVQVDGGNGSGVIDLAMDGTAGTTGNACGCAYNGVTWTRCFTTASRSGSWVVGNDGRANSCGSGTRSDLDVLLFGGQQEATTGTDLTSYIPTGPVGVVRAVDNAAFTGLSISSALGLCWSASTTQHGTNSGAVWGTALGVVQDATNRTQIYRANSNVTQCSYFSTAGSATAGHVGVYVARQTYRHGCYLDQAPAALTRVYACLNGACTASVTFTAGAITATSITPIALGAASTTGLANGIVSKLIINNSPTGCP